MPQTTEEDAVPDFEINHPEEFSQYLLSNSRDVIFFINLLTKRQSVVTAYLDDGQKFFLTTLVAIDEKAGTVLLDPPQISENDPQPTSAKQLTLVASQDKVKIQFRLAGVREFLHQGQTLLAAPIPSAILRLQRREYFRLEPPTSKPLYCKVAASNAMEKVRIFELQLSNISGGGLSLVGPIEIADYFSREAIFKDCRLDIPGEGVILVNLRVRKTIEISPQSGLHSLRIGCEYIGLPSSRLAMIERYITRIERERKARDSGLAQ
jgi:c-di-GMP-binding flagellar brake protein YcgR